jgi:hypothetical protein
VERPEHSPRPQLQGEAADSGDRTFKISAKAKAFPIDVTYSAFLAEEVGFE